MKCREAEHIHRTYLQIKMKLEDEQKSFGNTLDAMEQDIVRSDDDDDAVSLKISVHIRFLFNVHILTAKR